ncbi:MAG: hypothetical protein ABIF82_01095, partial [Planctomycetota bacterium]
MNSKVQASSRFRLKIGRKPQLPSWRKKFGNHGPAPDAPSSDVRAYYRLRLATLTHDCRLVVRTVAKKPWANLATRTDGNRGTSDEHDGVQADMTRIAAEFDNLKREAGLRGVKAAIERPALEVDLDDVADDICRRFGLGTWEATGEKSEEAAGIPGAGPHEGTPRGKTLAFFQNEYAEAGQQLGRMTRIAKIGGYNRAESGMVSLATRAIRMRVAVTDEWARTLGVVLGKEDPLRQQAIDLLLGEIRWRQRAKGVMHPKEPRFETLRWYVAKIRLARQGDYWAYREVNGFIRSSSSSKRLPMQKAPCHVEIVRARMANLICKGCGKFHLQDMTPVYDEARDTQFVRSPTCPHCGMKHCAGPTSHRIAACREIGKTEEMILSLDYVLSLSVWRGYMPSAMLVGSNSKQAEKRKAFVAQAMLRGAHRLVFPTAVPSRKQPAQTLPLENGRTILTVFGIESLPPGEHCDFIECDDVVNERNTFQVPALMDMVQTKIDDVLDYSGLPWTVLNWNTTVWRVGDPDHKLENYALEHPDQWVNCVVAAGGPEPVYDESGNNVVKEAWWSPWPQRWDAEELKS